MNTITSPIKLSYHKTQGQPSLYYSDQNRQQILAESNQPDISKDIYNVYSSFQNSQLTDKGSQIYIRSPVIYPKKFKQLPDFPFASHQRQYQKKQDAINQENKDLLHRLMNAKSSYPKKTWERHAVKYYNLKQQMQLASKKNTMMNKLENRYQQRLSGQEAYERVKHRLIPESSLGEQEAASPDSN